MGRGGEGKRGGGRGRVRGRWDGGEQRGEREEEWKGLSAKRTSGAVWKEGRERSEGAREMEGTGETVSETRRERAAGVKGKWREWRMGIA